MALPAIAAILGRIGLTSAARAISATAAQQGFRTAVMNHARTAYASRAANAATVNRMMAMRTTATASANSTRARFTQAAAQAMAGRQTTVVNMPRTEIVRQMMQPARSTRVNVTGQSRQQNPGIFRRIQTALNRINNFQSPTDRAPRRWRLQPTQLPTNRPQPAPRMFDGIRNLFSRMTGRGSQTTNNNSTVDNSVENNTTNNHTAYMNTTNNMFGGGSGSPPDQGAPPPGQPNWNFPSDNQPTPYTNQIGENYPRQVRRLAIGAAAATGGISAFVTGMILATNATSAYSRRISESQRYLEEYNAQIAVGFAQLELGRTQRNINIGSATSESNEFLNQSLNRLESAILPYQAAGQNALNNAMGTVATIMSQLLLVTTAIGENLPVVGDDIKRSINRLQNPTLPEDNILTHLFNERLNRAQQARRAGGDQ